MKTSTKLILIYSGLIVAGVIALYTFTHSIDKQKKPEQYVQYLEQIPDFSVVVVQDTAMCNITMGDSSRIKWEVPSESIRKSPLATVRNDTLFISHEPGDLANYYPIDVMAKQLTSVVVKSRGTIIFINPIQDKLHLKLENASCILSSRNNEKAALLSKTVQLTVNASKKSELAVFISIEALTVTLDSSMLRTYDKAYIRNVNLTEKHGSSSIFQVRPGELNIQRDSSSTVEVTMIKN
jgi:hypothetical protein